VPAPGTPRRIRIVSGAAIATVPLVVVAGLLGGRAIGAGVLLGGIVLLAFAIVVLFDVDGVGDGLAREFLRSRLRNVEWTPAVAAAQRRVWRMVVGSVGILQGVVLALVGLFILTGVF
jgi:hypothetical protein